MEIEMLLRTLTILVCLMTFACTAIRPAAAKPAAKWKLGTPIVTYWAGPSDFMELNDRTAEQLRAGGWNVGWAKTPEELDVYHRHGLRVMLKVGTPNVDDPAQAKALEDIVVKVRNHPALYAYYIVDEPGAGAFPALGKLVAFLRKLDPAHLAFINLLPTYASPEQLNVTDDAAAKAKVGIPSNFSGIDTGNGTVLRYQEHLRQFITTVKPELISYDHYHFMKNSDGPQYFLNLGLVRLAAMKAGIPFMNIIQTCDSPAEGWREPVANELRWLTYTSVAYGAQAIAHFRYDLGCWKDPKEATVPLPLYWALSQINREFVAIATELQPLKSLGAFHIGKMPIGGVALPANAVFAPDRRSQDLVLGTFGKSADMPTHVVVVNLDYKKAVSTTLLGPGAMEVFHPATKVWTKGSSRLKLDLPPCGGMLVRLAR